MPPIVIAGAIAAAGAVGGAAIASRSAGKAADTQAQAANQAAELQYKAQQEALAEQQRQFDASQQNMAPWLQAGQYGLSELVKGMPELTAPFTEQFKAPTVTDDPGYQFRVAEGQRALEHGAAARGGALSGGAVKEAMRYGQNMASQEYGNAYNRAQQEYQNRFNIFKSNQTDRYNRLAGVAGTGQTAAQQLNATGQNYANNVGNLYTNTANNVGDLQTQAANARASGYMGSANAWNNALGQTGNNVMNMIMLSSLFKNPGAASAGIPYSPYIASMQPGIINNLWG